MRRGQLEASGLQSIRRPTGAVARLMGNSAKVVGWLAVIALGALAVVRWTRTDHWFFLVGAAALSPWLNFLSWVVAVVAAVCRRWLLLCAASVLVALSIIWLVPQWYPLRRAAAPVSGSVRLRVFDANVEYSNTNLAGIAHEIEAAHPNLVTLEELSNGNLGSLLATGAMAAYRWKFVAPTDGSNGFGVWSDIPLSGAQLWSAAGHPEVSGWLEPPGARPVRLYVVHTVGPVPGGVAPWHDQITAVAARLRAESSRPLLVAGDFNATWDMYEFQDILHLGLRDAAAEDGKGWEMTWSRQLGFLPPLIRIDHVLYSKGITTTSYRTGIGQGSDHRPVIAELAIAPVR